MHQTEKLLFPLESINHSTVIIISQESFKNIYKLVEPISYYVVNDNNDEDSDKKIRNILAGSTSFQIVDKKEENLQQENNERLSRYLFGFFITLTALFSIINIYSLLILKLKNDIDIYTSYLILGLKRSRICLMFVLETISYYLLNILLSILGLNLISKVINSILQSYNVTYNMVTPMRVLFLFEALLALVLVAILLRVIIFINRIKVNAHSISVE